MKQKKTPAKKIKDLSVKKVPAKNARNVRGGAYEAYGQVKGTKQGALKGK